MTLKLLILTNKLISFILPHKRPFRLKKIR